MSTMGCIPEFLQCQRVGEKTWPGGKEAEGSWTGRWVREKVTDTLLHEQMATSSNSCPAQNSEPRKRCEVNNPRARAWRHFAIADILSGWWWERELVLWIQTSSLVMRFQKYFTEASNFSRDRGLAMATSTCTPRNGGVTSSTGLL